MQQVAGDEWTADRIARPRLAALTREALGSGSLVITAGAGYGKTTLLEQALHGSRDPRAWISCTATDGDPGALLEKLLGSISRGLPGALGGLSERLDRVQAPVDPATVASELRIELDRLLVEPLVVVFDDAERLEGSTGSLAAVSELLRAEGTMIRLAVASRRPLGLRIAKPRVSGRLTELGGAELAFTPEEAAALFARVRGTPASREQSERLIEITEGWPLGLALLAASTPQDGGDPISDRLPDGARKAIHSYLAEEILDSIEPELREAAIASSVVDTVTPEVVAALGFGTETIERLAGTGLPVRRDRDGGLVYHPLVRDLLRERLASGGAGRKRSLHARVAPVVADAGNPREAAEHLLAGEAWDELTELLDREGPRIIRTSPDLVRRWLDRLPPERAAPPAMRLLDGQLHWGAGDHPRARAGLEAAAEGMRARGDEREWLVRLMLFDALGSAGDLEAAIAAMAGIDDALTGPTGPFPPAAARFVAMALAVFGRFERSDQLEELASRHPDADAIVSLGSVRGAVIDYLRGRLDDGIAQLAAAARDAARPDPLNLRFYIWQSLTRLLDAAGRDDEAIATWQSVEDELGEALAPYAARGGNHAQAKLHARAGRLGEAQVRLAAGGPAERGWRAQDRELAVAWVAALEGDSESVSGAARRVIELQAGAPPLIQVESAVDIVPPLVMSGDLDRARSVVDATLRTIGAIFAGEYPRFSRARLLAMRAWISQAAGDAESSDRELRAMWTEAGDGRQYILRRERDRLLPLISAALERGALDPAEAVAALAAAGVGGRTLSELTRHPTPTVRRAAIRPALASGDPEAVRRLAALAEDPDPEVARAAGAARSALDSAVPPLRFRVLGTFAVERGAWRISDRDWGRPAAAKLIRFLVVAHPEPVPADAIAEALWEDLTPKSARGSLQVAVSRARRALDLPGSGTSVIDSGDGAYRLTLGERERIDSVEFDRAVGIALAAADADRAELLERARELWGGQPLPADRYEEWALAWRERLIDRFVDVLGGLLSLYRRRGDHPRTIDAARELIDLDPLNEGAHRELIAAYARAGRTGQALHQYLECRRRLIDELGVEPAEETSRLQAQILAGAEV